MRILVSLLLTSGSLLFTCVFNGVRASEGKADATSDVAAPESSAKVAEIARWLHALEMDPAAEKPSSLVLVTAQYPSSSSIRSVLGREDEEDGASREYCSSAEGSHLLTKSYKNKVDYCNMHGCSVRYVLEEWPARDQLTSARTYEWEAWTHHLHVLLRLMRTSRPATEWFLWMDAQALFTNFTFSFPLHTYDAWGKHFIVPGSERKVYGGDTKGGESVNPAMFLVRNSEWSVDFLSKWKQMGMLRKKGESTKVAASSDYDIHGEDDPATNALLRLLRRGSDDNGIRGKVFLEDGYYLHGHGDFIVESYEKVVAEGIEAKKSNWPFVVHFNGCNFCGDSNIEPISDLCLSGFQRAFHFADNQLLALVGLQHQQLYSTLAQPFRLDT